MTTVWSRRPGISLTAQIMVLVMSTVITAQAVTILAVFLAPPAPGPVYSIEQVAAALRGEAFATDQGRRLQRSEAAAMPRDLKGPMRDRFEADALAALLKVSPDRVKVQRLRPPLIVLMTLGMPWGPMHGPPPGPMGPPPGLPPDFRPPMPPPAFIILRGEFAAGLRQAGGGWVMVEPQADMEWLPRIAIWIAGGFLVMGPVGFWFAHRITAPLKGFAESAETLGRDPQATMMAPIGPAEIGVAAHAFNAMQARLQRYVADRVGMVGAISHDLRTPLTRMRFKLEGAPKSVQAAVLSDVAQMEHMIDAVIAFSKGAAAPSVRQRLDLTSLVVSCADSAAELGADVHAVMGPSVVVEGDPVGLQRLFANLIDNAVKYGDRAEVTVRILGGEALVEVADAGPGLPALELEKVFSPFYRTVDAQRGGASGVGLGLSIARAAARAHGGDVRLQARPDGLSALVTLPLARG